MHGSSTGPRRPTPTETRWCSSVNEPTSDPPGPMTATISLGADFDHPTSVVWKAFADIDQRVRWGVPRERR
jgi:hypothetical protein